MRIASYSYSTSVVFLLLHWKKRDDSIQDLPSQTQQLPNELIVDWSKPLLLQVYSLLLPPHPLLLYEPAPSQSGHTDLKRNITILHQLL